LENVNTNGSEYGKILFNFCEGIVANHNGCCPVEKNWIVTIMMNLTEKLPKERKLQSFKMI